MDFTKNGINKKQRNIKSTTARVSSKTRVTCARVALLLVVSLIIICVFAGFGILNGMIDTAPSISDINLVPSDYKTLIYYSDGTVADTLISSGSNRDYVTIDQIPKYVQYAFVAKEDERFYEHDGIDVRGIFRAIYSDITTHSLKYGASTLTQQLLKNQVFSGGDEDSSIAKITRKVQEQYLAIQIENYYDKDTILEYYLNTINLGNGSWGVQTAAQNYFGKDIWELTLSEAAVLAPIAYSPTNRNPINYPDENAAARLETLDLMLEHEFITLDEYNEAVADDVYARIKNYRLTQEDRAPYSYFTDELIQQILQDLQSELGLTEAEASDKLYKGGLKIYTTQDREIQSIVDKVYTDETNFPALGSGSYYEVTYKMSVFKTDGTTIHYQMKDFLNYFSDYRDTQNLYYHSTDAASPSSGVGISELCINIDDIYAKCDEFKAAMMEEGDTCYETRYAVLQPQSSMVIMEQSSGKVVAVYGGRGTKTASLVLNRATDTVRQVGSTFKVLASFLPALDISGMTLATVFDDTRYCYPNDPTKEVVNWYHNDNYFRGLQSIRAGIYNSLNIVAVKCIEKVTAEVSFEYLKKLGFSTLVSSRVADDGQVYSDIGLPLALGGLTDGVTNLELTAAYAAIANNGVYQEPIFYTAIYDHDDNLLLSNESQSTQVMKNSTAWLLTSAMTDTVKIGTGFNLRFKNYEMTVAGKTGTSTNANDLWFVGYTPYYTAGIWTGYDNNLRQTNTAYHQHIWRKIMEEIHTTMELPDVTFEVPDSIVSCQICTKCGKLAVAGLCDCALSGNCVATEYFAKGTAPTEICDCHVKVTICTESGHIASADCPEECLKEVVYLVKEELPFTMIDENGEEVTEQVETWDTPYILPTGDDELAIPCPIHSGQSVSPPVVNMETYIVP